MEHLLGLQKSVNCKKTPIIIIEEKDALFVFILLLFQINGTYVIKGCKTS
jgi:hypothetical protein